MDGGSGRARKFDAAWYPRGTTAAQTTCVLFRGTRAAWPYCDGKQPPASVGGHDLRLVPLLPPAQLVARDDPVLRLRRRRLPPDDERLGRRSFDGHVLRGVGWHVGVGPGDGIQMIRIE